MIVRSKTQTILTTEENLSRRLRELGKLSRLAPQLKANLNDQMAKSTEENMKRFVMNFLRANNVQINPKFGSSFNSERNVMQVQKGRRRVVYIDEIQKIIFDMIRVSGKNCHYGYEQARDKDRIIISPVIVIPDKNPRVLRVSADKPKGNTHIEIVDDYALKAIELFLEVKAIVDEALGYRVAPVMKSSIPDGVNDELFILQMRQAGRLIAAAERLWPHTQRRLDFDRYGVSGTEVWGISRILEHIEAPHLLSKEDFAQRVKDSGNYSKDEMRKVVRMSDEFFKRAAKEPTDLNIEIN